MSRERSLPVAFVLLALAFAGVVALIAYRLLEHARPALGL